MILRKKTKILCSYCLLATTALAVVAYDDESRCDRARQCTPAQPANRPCASLPIPINPIAKSPFPEARTKLSDTDRHIGKRTEPRPAPSSEKISAAANVYILNVSVRVECEVGPVSLNRGTQVHLVRQQDGKLLVTYKGTDFVVEKNMVTEDRNALAKLGRSSS